MRSYLLSMVLLVGLLITSAKALQTTYVCPSSAMKQVLKPMLKPDYKYDSSKITRIKLTADKRTKEIEVPMFIGEKYKFLFNTTEMPEGVNISIYDKKQGKKNRTLLYSIAPEMENDKNQTIFSFEPQKSRTMYVEYEFPSSATKVEGCVVFLLGYRI